MNSAKMSAALLLIASGFDALAKAVAETDVASAAPADKVKPAKPAKPKDPPAEDKTPVPDDEVDQARDEAPIEEIEEVTLEDLQTLGAALLAAKKRPAFVKVLETHGLKNLSSASADDYKAIWASLKAAGE